jgi:ubiquinone/menaquinone biosynthesis C-methylase UbiE
VSQSILNRLTNRWHRHRGCQAADVPKDHSRLTRLAEEIGADWKQSRYYDAAEQYMEAAWTSLIWPFIRHCDFSCVVDLAAGHGRNAERLREVSGKLYIVDINEENIQFCRERFAGDDKIIFIRNNGFTLDGINDEEVTLISCFDAMVHFDSDIVRAYLNEFYRVLKPGGYGFCHHSNYDKNPGGCYRDNPGWRNFMSQRLFIHYCAKAGLEVVRSQVIDWDTPSQDCLTSFRRLV